MTARRRARTVPLSLILLAAPMVAPAAAQWNVGVGGVPGAPVLDLYLQVLVADPGSSGGAAGTNPLRMHVE